MGKIEKSNIGAKRVFFAYIVALFWVLMSSCSHKSQVLSPALQQVERITYTNNYSRALDSLKVIDTLQLSPNERMFWHLMYEHNFLHTQILTQQPQFDTMPSALIAWFSTQRDYKNLGHAYFLKGREEYLFNDDTYSAMEFYKLAEDYLLKADSVNDYLIGKLYHQMSHCAMNDGLGHLSHEYTKLALDYLLKAKDYRTASAAQRRKAMTYDFDSDAQIPLIVAMIDTAIMYLEMADTSDYNYRKYHLIDKYDLIYARGCVAGNSNDALNAAKYITDSTGINHYANVLARYYMAKGMFDSAAIYISKYALDTLIDNKRITRWRYEQLKADYLYAVGDYRQAAQMYRAKAANIESQLQKDEAARVYKISRRYDLEKEKNRHLQTELSRQRLVIALLVLAIAIFLIVVIVAIVVSRLKKKQQQAEWERDKIAQQNQMLLGERQEDLELLRDIFIKRAQLTGAYKLEELKQHPENIQQPQWAKEFIESNIITDIQSQTDSILSQVNKLFGGVIDNLRSDYPKLTDSDLLILTFMLCSMSARDMALLLNRTTQGVYNQQTKIRETMGLHPRQNVSEWLQEYIINH